jgi:hypothetical protein
MNHTTSWSAAYPLLSLLLFLVLLVFVGILEGLQIALCAVVSSESQRYTLQACPSAQRVFDLAYAKHNNLESFLVGRQILVTIFMVSVCAIFLYVCTNSLRG